MFSDGAGTLKPVSWAHSMGSSMGKCVLASLVHTLGCNVGSRGCIVSSSIAMKLFKLLLPGTLAGTGAADFLYHSSHLHVCHSRSLCKCHSYISA